MTEEDHPPREGARPATARVPVRDPDRWPPTAAETVTVESAEAASHWDARSWHRSGGAR